MTFQVRYYALEQYRVIKSFTVSRLALMGLTGSYFSNPMLQGAPARTQTDSVVDFEWIQVTCCDDLLKC
jgi:hypothetical protein